MAGELGRTKAVLTCKHGDDEVIQLFLNNIYVSDGEKNPM